MTITLNRTHKGGYKTEVNGVTVEIEKQYSRETWVAQSTTPMQNGEYIDIERETLSGIRADLARLSQEAS
jgi:hypothetical protein